MYGDKVTDPDSQRIFKTVWHGFGFPRALTPYTGAWLLCLDGPSHPIKRSIRLYKVMKNLVVVVGVACCCRIGTCLII